MSDIGRIALLEACARSCFSTVQPYSATKNQLEEENSDDSPTKRSSSVDGAVDWPPVNGEDILRIDVSDWLSVVDEAFINKHCGAFKVVSLHFQNLKNLDASVCSLISETIGSKVIEISFDNCGDLTWSEDVKRILSNSRQIQTIRLSNNSWADDFVIEQLATRFHKSLQHLVLEKVPVTNSGIYHIGKRCSRLRSCKIICCSKVNDSGFLELTKKIKLQEVHVEHNMHITDHATEILFANSRKIDAIVLNNCPKLTDQTVSWVYEATASWGRKRNTESLSVHKVELRDNPNLTYQVLIWLSTSLPHLVSLDLRDCLSIDLVKGMNEMIGVKGMTELKLGPSSHRIDPDAFLAAMLYAAPQLRVLHLAGLRDLTDEHVADLLEAAGNLHTLTLVDIDFATLTVESLCSNIPNISNVHFIGSTALQDIDLRCLTSICRHLLEFTLQRCNRLTDAGFTRFVTLKMLKKMDLAFCSRQRISGAAVKFLSQSPLESLVIDGLDFDDVDTLQALSRSTITSLRELSMRKCPSLTAKGLQFALGRFLGCTKIDVTDCRGLPRATSLLTLEHQNPFLCCSCDAADFSGFVLSPEKRPLFTQHWAVQQQLRRHYGAKLMQRLRRRYLSHIAELKQLRRDQWAGFKVIMVTKIQRRWRGIKGRQIAKVRMQAARRIVHAARSVLLYREYLRSRIALKHYKQHLKRMLWTIVRYLTKKSIKHLNKKAKKVQEIARRAEMQRRFKELQHLKLLLQSRKQEDGAGVVWEKRFLHQVLHHWSTIINESTLRNQRLISVFLQCVDISTFNSIRHRNKVQLAEQFYIRRILLRTWRMLSKDLWEIRRINALTLLAVDHSKKAFFTRVVGACFNGFKKHHAIRRYKKYAVIRGAQHVIYYRKLLGCRKVWDRLQFHQREISSVRSVQSKVADFLLKKSLSQRFPAYTLMCLYLQRCRNVALVHLERSRVRHGFAIYKVHIVAMKVWRIKKAKAFNIFYKSFTKKAFFGWDQYRRNSKNLGKYYYKLYLQRMSRRVLGGLRHNVLINKEVKRALEMELERRAGTPENFLRVMFLLLKLQALFRGVLQRKRFEEVRITKLYSAQVLQNFARTCLARKRFGGRVRLQDIHSAVREGQEADLMREAELEKRYYDYQIKAIIGFQKVFRGWKGRLEAADAAVRYYRDKQIDFYQTNFQSRMRHEAYKRAAQAREQMRHQAATDIQKIVRGNVSRKKFMGMKLRASIAHHAVFVQRQYRRRLAEQKLRAMKREKQQDLRMAAARRQRGMLLRGVGFKTRKQQKILATALDGLGIDPITFNYRVRELWEETKEDFFKLIGIYRRERGLLKEHGYNRVNRLMGRRRVLAEQGYKYKVQDAVRIIDEGHKYEGYTGIITRIDETLLGVPLYEVKLDKFDRFTFVRMTTDPLVTYIRKQPLAKINLVPVLHEYVLPEVIYGHNKDDPFYDGNNVDAAWVIQRAFRCYRSRKIVARKRYEHWMRNTARQWSLYNHLAETNTLSTQGLNVAAVLRVRPHKPVFFDEIRHPVQPGRFASHAAKPIEANVISKEFDVKYRDRVKFLQKAALMKGKEYFAVGYERINSRRKTGMFFSQAFGLFRNGGAGFRDLFGSRGARFLSRQKSMVTGLDKYCFTQFQGSPHVRYYKTSIYQGEWSGIPLFTSLRPHGEGMIIFLDGWGFAREDKVLYLTIVRCRYLNAMDLSTSDPYCHILCNGIELQTTVKWQNLDPEYHESFEIDVTNPSATLNIVVKDKDYLGSDDFMGQILLPLSDFEDGKEHTGVYLLKGEDVKLQEDFDRGEIEIRLRWAERKYEDDQLRIAIQNQRLVQMQAFLRRVIAISKLKALRKEREQRMKIICRKAVQITNTCRIRLARKEFKRRTRFKRSAIRIQKRVRIWIAKKVFARRMLRRDKATIIQTKMRVCLAKARVVRLKEKVQADLDATVTLIQKNVRRMVVLCEVRRRRLKESEHRKMQALMDEDSIEDSSTEGGDTTTATGTAVADWLPYYGVDPDYGLKRNRRITERLFKKLLKMRYVRLLSRFGVVYVECYPPKKTDEEVLAEMTGAAEEALTIRDDFVSVYFPPFDPVLTHRAEAIENFRRFPHVALLHLPTSVEMRKSVDYNITIIQCFQRQRLARRAREKLIQVHKAIALFQRIFRMRFEVYHRAAVTIIGLFRLIRAKIRTRVLGRERRAAMILQMSYRSFKARSVLFDLRCVEQLSVLKSSPNSVQDHGPEKALEHRDDTFWIAETTEKAEIRVEMAAVETITEVWIQTSMYESSPAFVSIMTVPTGQRAYEELVDRAPLPLLIEHRWHRFQIPSTQSKYFKLIFIDNYGDENHIAVRQIRFMRSPEKSATIVKQPQQFILDQGPSVGDSGVLLLKCHAEGWPKPTFQWFKGSLPITGATSPELRLELYCATYGARSYRCIRCKMVSRTVPYNAYHIKCGNCSQLFAYKDIEEYDKEIEKVKKQEDFMNTDKNSLIASRVQLLAFNNKKYDAVIEDLNSRIDAIEEKLQVLREKRVEIKQRVETVNHFTNEGVYTCHVSNIRGGSMKIRRRSVGAVVVVEHSVPFVVSVAPVYTPRAQVLRKKWNVYASVQGTFRKGRLEGLVVIRYYDNSMYEGPYIPEEALDLLGRTIPEARAKDHYGVYKLADGRVFEGQNVDNHFDPNNLQSSYRLTLPNHKGVYEGHFCDEMYHGTGMFTFEDGSVYEGSWFRGTRFGHGHFRSAEGWTYEGFFDTDRRHRHGTITWPDGSCYMGEWYYNDINGKGVYVTTLRDVYKGELQQGKFHGRGELLYADGSQHIGDFVEGRRHGVGVFTMKDGSEYYGLFRNDVKHGEHVVKIIIPIEERGQDNYEIRIGLFDNGKFVKWKIKFSNPVMTKQFVTLFRHSREMFDSVYSMMLAKHLPNLPDGIDANNQRVKSIVFKIRNEAGMLVGEHALNQAKAQLQELLTPLEQKKAEVDQLNDLIEEISLQRINIEKEATRNFYKFTNLIAKYEKDTQKIEQYWIDEPTEVRAVFSVACKQLETISVDEFFDFRNHRVVPPFVKKIFDALSCLLDLSMDWHEQQFIIADSMANARHGDEEALRHYYKCKLADMMKTYKVYDYVHYERQEQLEVILADSRFRRDSYYIESTGKPGPVLVDWIKTNFAYINAARDMYGILHNAEETRKEAYRFKAVHAKKSEEVAELERKKEDMERRLQQTMLDLAELELSVVKANDLLAFISGRYNFGKTEAKRDIYKEMEQKIEEKREFFTIEVCMESIVSGVLERAEKEQRLLINEVLSRGEQWKEPEVEKADILSWIREEVLTLQGNIHNNKLTLGYNFEPEETDVTWEFTLQQVTLVVELVTGKLNDAYNDFAAAREWLSMKGRRFGMRFLYLLTWRCWEQEALAVRDAQAVQQWQAIFGEAAACARAAIEARISTRMSKVAREQAKVWARCHPEEIAAAEQALAAEFEAEYESLQEAAKHALGIAVDDSGTTPPSWQAACVSWMRLHPEEVNVARDEQNAYLAALFEENFPQLAGEVCFKVLNGWGNSEEMEWVEYADHWRSFNMEAYDAAGEALVLDMGSDFEEKYPTNTFQDAARIIVNNDISQYVLDADVQKEFVAETKDLLNANCWAVKNQGMLRKGKDMLHAEYRSNLTRQWNDLMLQTDSLRKGSVLFSANSTNAAVGPTDQDGDAAAAIGGGKQPGDRFAGFRNRLANKFAWMYGFLCYRQSSVVREMEDLEMDDPLHKVHHRVRPSEFDKVDRAREDDFLVRRRALEKEYEELIERIAAWNTYFGINIDQQRVIEA